MEQFLNNLTKFVEIIKIPITITIMVLILIRVACLKFVDQQQRQNCDRDSKTQKDTLDT